MGEFHFRGTKPANGSVANNSLQSRSSESLFEFAPDQIANGESIMRHQKTRFANLNWMASAAAILGCVSIVCANPVNCFAQTDQSSQDKDEVTRTQLDQVISIDYEDVEFETVLNKMGEISGLNFVTHPTAMDVGLTEDDLVTMKFSKTRLRTALVMFLDKYDCTFAIRDGILILMTKEEAENHHSLRIYDCQDLIMIHQQGESNDGSGSSNSVGGASGSGGLFNAPESLLATKIKKANSDRQELSAPSGAPKVVGTTKPPKSKKSNSVFPRVSGYELTDIINRTCEPDSWDDVEGNGVIQELNGMVFVKNTETVHHEIENLLRQLRQKISARK